LLLHVSAHRGEPASRFDFVQLLEHLGAHLLQRKQ
jgi:hypothetical protein